MHLHATTSNFLESSSRSQKNSGGTYPDSKNGFCGLIACFILGITNYSLRTFRNAMLITFSLTSKHFLSFLCDYRNHTPVLFSSSLPFSIYSERRNGRQELIEVNKEQVKNLHVRRRTSIITRVSICNHLHHNSCICRCLRIFHIYHHHSRH